MKSFGEDRSSAAGHAIQSPCDPGADGHHATREGVGIRRLDHEVRVRVLQSVVDQPEVRARANRGEAALEIAHERDRAERGQPGPEPHGHVDGVPCGDAFAPTVWNAGVGSVLPSGPAPPAAPPAVFPKVQRELRTTVLHTLI